MLNFFSLFFFFTPFLSSYRLYTFRKACLQLIEVLLHSALSESEGGWKGTHITPLPENHHKLCSLPLLYFSSTSHRNNLKGNLFFVLYLARLPADSSTPPEEDYWDRSNRMKKGTESYLLCCLLGKNVQYYTEKTHIQMSEADVGTCLWDIVYLRCHRPKYKIHKLSFYIKYTLVLSLHYFPPTLLYVFCIHTHWHFLHKKNLFACIR